MSKHRRAQDRPRYLRRCLGGATAVVLAGGVLVAEAGPAAAVTQTANDQGQLTTLLADASTDVVVLGASISITDGSHLAVSAAKAKTLDLHGQALSISGVGDDAAAVDVSGAALTISDSSGGGSLTATGGLHGAGIGGGNGAAGGSVTVTGGSVAATGGTGGAGVGGGAGGAGGSLTMNGGGVVATGGANGAGVGGGNTGSGGSVTIGSGATITASDGLDGHSSAVGVGASGASFGSLDNSGGLVIPAGATLRIGAGSTLHNANTVFNKGTVTVDPVNGAGTLANDGTILNTGTIQADGAGGTGNLTVSNHSYRLDYDVHGGPSSTPPSQFVYAASLLDVGASLPAVAPPAGGTFLGWYTQATGGTQVTTTTDLSTVVATGPSHATLYAHYRLPQTITFPVIGDQTYGAPDFTVSATASSGLPVTFTAGPSSICTISGATVHLVGAGSCTVSADQAGSTDFLPAPQARRSFQVRTGVLTVTATGSQTYGGSPVFVPSVSLPAGVSLGGTLSCTRLSGGVTIRASLAPGNYTVDPVTCGGISLTGSAAGNYHMVYGGGTFVVSKADVVVTATGSENYQASPAFHPVATTPPNVSLAGSLSCTRLVGGAAIDAALAVGSYTVDAASCSGLTLTGLRAAGYQIVYADGPFTVSPVPVRVTATGTEGYGGTPTFTPQATLPDGIGLSGTLQCTRLTGNIAISPTMGVSSSYTIDATSCGGLSLAGALAGNYQLVYANGPFTVTKAHVVIDTHTNTLANAFTVHHYVFTSTVTNTDAHAPVAQVTVSIAVKIGWYTVRCSAKTDADGVATCSSANGNLFLHPRQPFTATTPASANYLAGSATGSLGS